MAKDNNPEVFIRMIVNADIPQIIKIENENFAYPWEEHDFKFALKESNVLGLVATKDNKIVGYIIYQMTDEKYHIINMAINVKYHRQRIGTMLLNKILRRLSFNKRTKVVTLVSESNLIAQLFLKKNSFSCIKTLKNYYDENDMDAYVMEFDLNYGL